MMCNELMDNVSWEGIGNVLWTNQWYIMIERKRCYDWKYDVSFVNEWGVISEWGGMSEMKKFL